MKVYIDSSCLNRIFDDQSQPRIFIESMSMIVIFTMIENGQLEIVSSDSLQFELDKNPFEERKIFVSSILKKAKFYLPLSDSIYNRAKEIELMKIKGLDAFHVAFAESMDTDFLLTVDDNLIKKYKGKIKIMNPIIFLNEIFVKGESI